MGKYKYRRKRSIKEASPKVKKSGWDAGLTKMAKREFSITLVSIFGVVLLSLGSAFAVFTTTNRSKDYNVIKVGTLNIDFGADSDNTINLNGQYPVSDAAGLRSTPYTFTITNTGTLSADYTVSILDDEEMISQDNCSTNQLNKAYIKYSLDGTNVGLLSDLAASDYQIDVGTLAAGASKTYTLYVWIADNAGNDVLDKHYHGKIVVNGVNEQGQPVMKSKADGVWDSFTSDELSKVKQIVTKKNAMVPETAIKSVDFSEKGDNSVVAYLENIGTNGATEYKLTIGGNGGVIAPSDSSQLFYNLSNAVSIDLSNFDTSNVTNMGNMFADCSSLTSLNLTSFDTSNVTTMTCMFFMCSNLTSLDLSGFDTSKVTDMSCMFNWCGSLTSLNLTSFDTSQVTNMMGMFDATTAMTQILVSSSKWTTANANTKDMFTSCGVSSVTYV